MPIPRLLPIRYDRALARSLPRKAPFWIASFPPPFAGFGLKPDLVVIDPISHLSVEGKASEVMNAIRIIRQAAGVGEDALGILLVAHTKKPRSEESMCGRNLAHAVSGSVARVNTSRCTYLCVPFDTDDIENDRIYFAAPKINDGPNDAPTVWKRSELVEASGVLALRAP